MVMKFSMAAITTFYIDLFGNEVLNHLIQFEPSFLGHPVYCTYTFQAVLNARYIK